MLAVGLAYFGLPELFDPPMLEEVPSLSVDLVTQNEIAKMNPVKLQAPKKIVKKLPASLNVSVPRLKKKNELKPVLKPKIVVKKPEPKLEPKPKTKPELKPKPKVKQTRKKKVKIVRLAPKPKRKPNPPPVVGNYVLYFVLSCAVIGHVIIPIRYNFLSIR